MDIDAEFTLTVNRSIPRVPVPPAQIEATHIPPIGESAAPLDAENKDFRLRAACRSVSDPDVFFSLRQVDIAKAYCRSCPVKVECLAFAMSPDVVYRSLAEFGVFGGLTEDERRSVPVNRGNVA